MTTLAPPRRPAVASRRFGYAVALLVNGAMLYAVNRWPGWEAVPFLTADTPKVLGIVNASIAAGVVANALYLLVDSVRFKALGDIVTTSIGLVAMVVIWQVFPFAFGPGSVDWALVVRVLGVVAIVGSGIAILVSLTVLVTG
ncbi:MAG TPA: hypothetical protein VFJ94_00765 [Intrasporangium sp.]|uniref:hypothetical protein n=1 Tax=Intrasporangium sp. TaxID=1925024 RepID=UPI002D766E3B|nr:hypothetical protein [Intrasporangium sp.]HET7397023.1 hypothetical protein [Intrasporangium sp.]